MLIIGHSGYIGSNLKNLVKKFKTFDKKNKITDLNKLIYEQEIIVHLAAKQKDENNNFEVNYELTRIVVDELSKYHGKLLVFSSSVHANSNSEFGLIKKKEENYIKENIGKNYYHIYRIPHTYGPYAKTNYNNFFSTFAESIWKEKPVIINSTSTEIKIISINKILDRIIKNLENKENLFEEFEQLEIWNIVEILYEMQLCKENKSLRMSNEMKLAFNYYKNV